MSGPQPALSHEMWGPWFASELGHILQNHLTEIPAHSVECDERIWRERSHRSGHRLLRPLRRGRRLPGAAGLRDSDSEQHGGSTLVICCHMLSCVVQSTVPLKFFNELLMVVIDSEKVGFFRFPQSPSVGLTMLC